MGRSPRNATTLRRCAGALLALALGATACTPASTDDTDGAAGGGSGDAVTLARFNSCDAFAAEVQRRALEDVSLYGVESLAFASRATDAVALEADAGAAPAAGQDFSGTNVQEDGVDEPDVVKTDGRFIYSVADGVLRIVDVRGPRPEVAATLRAGDGVPRELLLHGTRLLLLGDDAPTPRQPPGVGPQLSEPADVDILPIPPVAVRMRMWAVDVSAPSDPRITSTMAVDGTLVTSRAVDGTARIVLRSTPLPAALVMPGGEAPDADRAVAISRQRIRNAAASEWLPHATVDDAPPEPLVACTAVHRPPQGAGTGMVSVLSVELDRPELGTDRVDAVLGAAETVYADRDSLYVTTSRRPQILPVEPLPVEPLPVEPLPRPPPVEPDAPTTLEAPATPSEASHTPEAPAEEPTRSADASQSTSEAVPTVTTEIHRFDLAPDGGAAYVASGSVDGTVLNQWALSEHDDDLRIATTTPADRGRRSASAVTVLRQDGDRLAQVGRVGDLGRGERIYAVRYAGPIGFVVTFRQVDPLYTLDLSDPRAPRVLGELKIPGYSAYLHPVGDHQLLGIGQNADRRGRTTGLQMSLFDIGDLSAPTRVAQLTAGPRTSSPVEHDHRALLSWPPRDVVALPVEHSDDGTVGVLVLEAADDATLRQRGTVSVPQGPEHLGGVVRSLVVGDRLVTVTPGVVVVSDLDTLQQVGAVVL